MPHFLMGRKIKKTSVSGFLHPNPAFDCIFYKGSPGSRRHLRGKYLVVGGRLDSQAALVSVSFVQLDKVTECHRKFRLLSRIEWINSERFFKTYNDERETKRVKTRLKKLEVVGQIRQLSLLFQRD